ncbi:MAG: hypothetical protein R6U57_07270 [Anaerolineales bacterium]
MNSDRGHWYLITALVLGVSLGLLISWVIAPVRLEDTHPKNLREDYKDVYRSLIARAYQANQNLPRAKARLDLLGDENAAQALAAQAQRSLAEQGDQETARILVNLSAALQRTPAPEETSPSPTPPPEEAAEQGTPPTSTENGNNGGTPEGTDTYATRTPLPPPTFTPTDAPPFIVEERTKLCDPNITVPLIQVFATNADGEGVPGVEILISWAPDRQERFLTGLKPEIGKGYADFEAEMGVTYTIEIPESGLVISDVVITECQPDSGDPYPGSYQIYITYPN